MLTAVGALRVSILRGMHWEYFYDDFGARPAIPGLTLPQVLAALKNAGLANSVHVQGGVIAWQAQVDPSLPIY